MTDGIQYQGLFVPKQSTEPSKGQYMFFFKKKIIIEWKQNVR